MGYESKLYIVETYNTTRPDTDGRLYAHKIAMFDMCKCYFLSDVLTKQPKTNRYIYADDGNTKILEDCYGDELTETKLETVIEVLEEAIENGEDYRRIFPLLSMLKVFHEQEKEGVWDNLAVLHYGY